MGVMSNSDTAIDRKTAAVDFLQRVVDGKIEEAYEKYVNMAGRHHNSFTAAGMPALKKGMMEADKMFPNKQWTVKHVLGDGDLVAIHSHMVLSPGKTELATLHLVRFEGDKIVEFWDLAQPIPEGLLNRDGMF
jgi:predicted SnoaL-like aldol condensation-catalyzing enzyme